MKPKVELLLREALAACDTIARRIDKRDYSEFLTDEDFRYGVLWNLTIIGEALNQAAAEIEGLEKESPALRSIVGMRNRIVHGYRSIDDEIVWEAATVRAPELRAHLAGLLNIAGSTE